MLKLEWFIQTSTISDVPQETATTTTAIMTTTTDELQGLQLRLIQKEPV